MKNSRNVTLIYFASLRDAIGQAEEVRTTDARTPLDLLREVREDHRVELNRDRLRVAINDEMAEWDDEVHPGDDVVFLPPVAGGSRV